VRKIKVKMSGGDMKEVRGTIVGPFGVHHSLQGGGGEWTISHLNTGLSIGTCISLEVGREMAEALDSELEDFEWDEYETKADLMRAIHTGGRSEMVQDILQAFGDLRFKG